MSTSVQGVRLFLVLSRRPPSSPLFPYTTLFRSPLVIAEVNADHLRVLQAQQQSRGWTGGIVTNGDRKSTRLNSSHITSSYAVFCLKKKKTLHTVADSARTSTRLTSRHVTRAPPT